MCGINGIFAYHVAANAPDPAELLATRDAMQARGPDGAGAWWSPDRRVALAHRRLAILDLSERGAQPMASADGTLVVTFNGEIYNYPELRAALERRGHVFRSMSDTEVLLHLYAEKGEAMAGDLRGMFAFAIWDSVRKQLFLARDPYGIKPLYYANDGWTFRFASQVKALLAGGKISREVEPAGLVGFHLWGTVPEPFTMVQEVRALPAGHAMVVDWLGPREPAAYFSIARILSEAGAGNGRVQLERKAALVRSAALDSVRHHLLADVEVGVFLSSGIDSGALLGLMRDAGQDRITAITLAFDEFRGSVEDEAPLARQAADFYGARHVVRRVSEAEFMADLPHILDAMDQPSIDGVNTWFVSKAAREEGLKVALSGLGGDELLGGYPSFADIPRWRRRVGPFARLPGVGALVRRMARAFAPRIVARQPKAVAFLDLAGSWEGAYLLRRGLFMPFELDRLLGRDLAREGLRRLEPLKRVRETIRPDPGAAIPRVCALESANYMRNQLLRDADWAGMAHSVEIRTPLVDAALLRALAPMLPALRPGEGKRLLAQAPLRPLLPAIADRAKTGFFVPTAQWMNAAAGGRAAPPQGAMSSKGLGSRSWAQHVQRSFSAAGAANG